MEEEKTYQIMQVVQKENQARSLQAKASSLFLLITALEKYQKMILGLMASL